MGCRKLSYYQGKEALGENLKIFVGGIEKTASGVKNREKYYSFGMVMPNGNNLNMAEHTYGFQGQMNDNEIKGAGNSLNYTFRMHDPRLGRFFAVDPLTAKYPFYTPYSFSGNRLINAVELEGLEPKDVGKISIPNTPATTGNIAKVTPKSYSGGLSTSIDKSLAIDKTSSLKGFSDVSASFNQSFQAGLWERTSSKGLSILYQDFVNFADNTMTFMSDVTGISNLVGNENQTAQAFGNLAQLIGEIPSMNNEQRGQVYAHGSIMMVQMLISKKMPFVGKYQRNPKHGAKLRGRASAAPGNPHISLANSFELPGNTTRRIATDKGAGEFVIFAEHSPNVFHGFTSAWKDLTQSMKNTLIKNGAANRRGKILK